MNLFDAKSGFFVIDTENLISVRSALYGFAIIENNLVDHLEQLQQSLCSEQSGKLIPPGDGAYVFVQRTDELITIYQDFIGSFGLYLYEEAGYFAISNSFMALVDHLKGHHPITFHQDYANYILNADLCSASFSETMIHEIRLLDRAAVVTIDIASRQLKLDYVDYQENSVELNSPEGMAILDRWYRKWTGLIHNLHANHCNIQADLSGGMDSRLILNLLLGADIQMNDLVIYSIHDDLHTHSEDWEIASAISSHYDFALDSNAMFVLDSVNYTIDDSVDISYYLKLGFHKQMYPRFAIQSQFRHCFGGSGGECVRSYWNSTPEAFIENALKRCNLFSPDPALQKAFQESTRRILTKAFADIREKFQRLGRPVSEKDLPLHLYRETRCRNHFGKDMVENFYSRSVKYAPLLDQDLHKLKLNDAACADKNLLIAVMFDRYHPDLLSFKFDSGRCIDSKTIAYAKALNQRYPYRPDGSSIAPPLDCPPFQLPREQAAGNPEIGLTDYAVAIRDIFESEHAATTLSSIYNRDLYNAIHQDTLTRSYHPLQNAHAAIGIIKFYQDVQASQNLLSSTPSEFFRNACTHPLQKPTLLQDPYLQNYVALRMDIKLESPLGSKLEILDVTDPRIKITNPAWFSLDRSGYVLESCQGSVTLTLRCAHAGNLSVVLRSRDVRDSEHNRIPFWLDLHDVRLNDHPQLQEVLPIWHDTPYRLSYHVNAGETLQLHFRWTPHDERASKRFRQ